MSNSIIAAYQQIHEPDSYKRMEKLYAIKGEPHGSIQWKGTDVCMDIYCQCGAHLHADESFLYFVKCGHCDRAYRVSPYVHLMELTPEEEYADKDRINHVLEDKDYEPNRAIRFATGD